jgi:hypothetical protein
VYDALASYREVCNLARKQDTIFVCDLAQFAARQASVPSLFEAVQHARLWPVSVHPCLFFYVGLQVQTEGCLQPRAVWEVCLNEIRPIVLCSEWLASTSHGPQRAASEEIKCTRGLDAVGQVDVLLRHSQN